MVLHAEQIFDSVYLNREHSSEFINYVSYGVERELITKVMDKLKEHKLFIVQLQKPELTEDLSESCRCTYRQSLVCMEVVQCKNCRMAFPWCHRFRDELGGNGFCPYGREIEEIIEKRAACDRENTDCTVCFKESHCKALAKVERELK